MQRVRFTSLSQVCGVFMVCVALWTGAHAQTQTTLYSFSAPSGGSPAAPLTIDHKGNLLGTTGGNSYDFGIVFELSPVSGGWSFNNLMTLTNLNQGESPSTNLVIDQTGNLFGATYAGGQGSCFDFCGLIFELSPNGIGGYTKNTIYYFATWGHTTDGMNPTGRIVTDAAGNLYGTTEFGGTYGGGTVFELSPQSGGGWNETILYSFGTSADYGLYPVGGVTFDRQGNLYGTTLNGGINSCSNGGCGTVFELSPGTSGWTEKILHAFVGTDGYAPEAPVIFDRAGNIYSTTDAGGGAQNVGVVFRLHSSSGGNWQIQILHTFNAKQGGQQPRESGVTLDANGNLYGTTTNGGTSSCGGYGCGLVYRLVPVTGGWKYEVVYDFTGGNDGSYPDSTLILDSKGNLYGTALTGGSGGAGTVFEITP